MYSTVESIARDLEKKLVEEDRQIISGQRKLEGMERIWFETAVKRGIRNMYGLWYDNPITEKWRTDESSRDITEDGVDMSYDHPDAVSNRVFQTLKERCAYYPTRPVTVHSPGQSDRGWDGAACVIVKRTKNDLIQVARADNPKKTITVPQYQVKFVDPVMDRMKEHIDATFRSV